MTEPQKQDGAHQEEDLNAIGDEFEVIPLGWVPHVHCRPRSPVPRASHSAKKNSSDMSRLEQVLFNHSRGQYNPMEMRERRRPRAEGASTAAADRNGKTHPGIRTKEDGQKVPCGRVSVVTPTTDSRLGGCEQQKVRVIEGACHH